MNLMTISTPFKAAIAISINGFYVLTGQYLVDDIVEHKTDITLFCKDSEIVIPKEYETSMDAGDISDTVYIFSNDSCEIYVEPLE